MIDHEIDAEVLGVVASQTEREAERAQIRDVQEQLAAQSVRQGFETPVTERLDPEITAMRAAQIMRQPLRPAPEPEPVGEVSADVLGSRMAARMLEEEAAAQVAWAKARGKRAASAAGPRMPVRASQRHRRRSGTTLPPHIQAQIRSDEVPKFIRTTDSWGNPDPNLSRVQELREDYSYRVITDPEDGGKPYVTRFGVLMACPMEQYAQRIADHAPPGAAKLRESNDAIQDKLDWLNEKRGHTAARVVGEGSRPDPSPALQRD